MTNAADNAPAFLLADAGSFTCALPLSIVIETMRVLPMKPLADAPPFLLGLSLIRGAFIPVVDFRCLVSGELTVRPRRSVTVRIGQRTNAVVFEAVIGIAEINPEQISELPSFLAQRPSLHGIGTDVGELDALLEAVRLVPDGVWQRPESGNGTVGFHRQ